LGSGLRDSVVEAFIGDAASSQPNNSFVFWLLPQPNLVEYKAKCDSGSEIPEGPRIDLVIDIALLFTSTPLTDLIPILLFKDKYPVGVWEMPMLLERLLQPATPGSNAAIKIETRYPYEIGYLVRSCGKAHRAPHDAS
jgi:hypothetical protein